MIGKGFIHDDFVHLFSASHDSLVTGLTAAADGPFYAPVTWLTFRFDWRAWGVNPFLMAVENLLLHILTMFLIYALTVRLYGSRVAAFWSAFGFGLLLPANTWATMWISTRAHLLATAFYVAALITMLAFLRSGRSVTAAAVFVLGFAAIFSKESAVTLPAALALLVVYEKRSRQKPIPVVKAALLIAALAGVVGLYLFLRGRSGAVPFSFHAVNTYTYSLSVRNLWSNFLEYFWRTFGMLIIVGGTLALSQRLNGARILLNLPTRIDVAFAVLLYAIMISPFMPLASRSGIYTYMPAVASAVLLGAMVRSFYEPRGDVPQRRPIAMVPVLLVVLTFTIFIVGQSQRWIVTAKTTTEVLKQMSMQVARPLPNTYFVLRYKEPDPKRKFPGGFATWSFQSTLRLHYADPSLDGAIVQVGAPYSAPAGSPTEELLYTTEMGQIKILRTGPDLIPQK